MPVKRNESSGGSVEENDEAADSAARTAIGTHYIKYLSLTRCNDEQ